MAITKNNNQVKINSGNDFMCKLSSTWGTLGNIVSGKLTKKSDTVEVTWASGDSLKRRGKTASGMVVVLGQVAKEIMDKIDTLLDQQIKIYFYNGKDLAGKNMGFFAADCSVVDAIELDMGGNKHQTLQLEVAFNPQSAFATCTPDTDLPTGTPFTGAVLLTGFNNYYIILEQ